MASECTMSLQQWSASQLQIDNDKKKLPSRCPGMWYLPLLALDLHTKMTTVWTGYLTKSFHYGFKKKKSLDWCIPPSPLKAILDASKSMRGGVRMYMSGENGPWFDCLPTCEGLGSSHVCWRLKGGDNISLRPLMPVCLLCHLLLAVQTCLLYSCLTLILFFGPILLRTHLTEQDVLRLKWYCLCLFWQVEKGFQQNLDKYGGCVQVMWMGLDPNVHGNYIIKNLLGW